MGRSQALRHPAQQSFLDIPITLPWRDFVFGKLNLTQGTGSESQTAELSGNRNEYGSKWVHRFLTGRELRCKGVLG